MENENTEYKDGDHDSFIEYVFKDSPKEKNSIKLELDPPNKNNNINKHIFEQLLMIYIGGLKYLWSDENGKVDLTKLTTENIELMKRYFESINYLVNIDVFNLQTYQFRFPNYFKDQHKITDETMLSDFFYETQGSDTNMYRISFDFL